MISNGYAGPVERFEGPLPATAFEMLHTAPVGSEQPAKPIDQLRFDIDAAAPAGILPSAAELGLDPALQGCDVDLPIAATSPGDREREANQ